MYMHASQVECLPPFFFSVQDSEVTLEAYLTPPSSCLSPFLPGQPLGIGHPTRDIPIACNPQRYAPHEPKQLQ